MNKTPFFSRFVEKQSPAAEPKSELPVKTNLRAGRPPVTLKYPSDRDEQFDGR